MDLRLSGSNQRNEYGRFPSVCMNNNRMVVETHQKSGQSLFYYQVGEFKDNEISWGTEHYLDKGDYAKIAINDDGHVVEVHECELLRYIYYRVGRVIIGKEIEWGKSYYLDGGSCPAVVLGIDGRVVIVYERAYLGFETYYCTGTLNTEDKCIMLTDDKMQLFTKGVKELSVAINRNGYLVVAGRESQHMLIYRVGQFTSDTCTITWGNETSFDMNSNYPSVGLDDSGHVVSVQQSNFGRHLTYRTGKIDFEKKRVQWCSEQKGYDVGTLPVIALSNGGEVVEEHETNFGIITGFKLFYRIGSLQT